MKKAIMRCIMTGGAFFLLFLIAAGCDEAQERRVCTRLAPKLCDKWFDCWPLFASVEWGTETACATDVRENCMRSEQLHGCDVDNALLIECDDTVEGTSCGSLPPSCEQIMDCFYDY